MNSSLHEVGVDDLVLLKELIANGTTVNGVPELLKVLQANGDGNLFRVLNSSYTAASAELEKLPLEIQQMMGRVNTMLCLFSYLLTCFR